MVKIDSELKERIDSVLDKQNEHAYSAFDPQADQTWHTDRNETIESIKNGGKIVGSTSCDMIELLSLAEKNDWLITFEASGVYKIKPE